MQRQLDHDLSDAEQDLLDAHVKNCLSCQAMLERLERLTSELSNLPKVHPPVSLVDAIMPRLEEIDRTRSQQAGVAEPLRSDARTARANKRKRLYQTAVGIVAASVLLGVAIVNFNPGGLQRTADQATGMSGSYSPELANATTSSSADAMMQDEFREGQLMQSADGGMSSAPSIRAAGADEDSAGQMAGIQSFQSESEDSKDAAGDVTVREMTSRGSSVDAAPDIESLPKESEILNMALQVTDQSGVAGVLSPGGDYLAAIEGDSVVIYDASGELIYYSRGFDEAEISELVWVSESRLTFWIKLDGAEHSNYIDLAERMEGTQ